MPREGFMIFNSGPFASGVICWRECIGKGSCTQMDDFEVEISLLDKSSDSYVIH